MDIIIVTNKVSRRELKDIASKSFGDIVKAVVDIDRGVMAIGGELHADEEAMLLEQGSKQKDLWGINLYPDKPEEEWIEFDSVINIRLSIGNRSRGVEAQYTREKIKEIVNKLTA